MLKRSITASIALLGATTALTLSATTFANDHQGEINPWQHCGIGAAIFDDNTTAAAISNVIWDSGTTAVTSATISPGSCEGEEIKVKILSIDVENQRIGLSIKQTIAAPAKAAGTEKEELQLTEKVVKEINTPLKGGTNRPSGGEKFGLKW